jgi:hypothetical protein
LNVSSFLLRVILINSEDPLPAGTVSSNADFGLG